MKLTLLSSFLSLTFASSLANATGYEEAELSDLFTSKSTRDNIDQRRDGLAASGNFDQDRRTPGSITVNGIIKRSDGKHTVWVNGRDMKSRTIDGVKVARSQNSTEKVSVYVDGKLVKVKPGERWSEDTD